MEDPSQNTYYHKEAYKIDKKTFKSNFVFNAENR